MTAQEIKDLITGGDIAKCLTVFKASPVIKDLTDITKLLKEYDPLQHAVMDPAIRRDKKLTDGDGKFLGTIAVARLPLSIQKQIVITAAAFLGSPTLEATPNGETEENLMFGITKTSEDNKLDYKFRGIVKKTKSVLQAAELWYTKEDKEYWDGTKITSMFRLRMRVISPALGDTLLPIFDDYDDMIAFGRYYKGKSEGKDVEYFDIYMADRIYFNKKTGSTWESQTFESDDTRGIKGDGALGYPNMSGKIPVIYYHQLLTEWSDVQLLIDQLELMYSKLSDTNDYNGSPIMVAQGKVLSFSEKGEAGKLVELTPGAKLEYLTYDSAPESIKLEMDNLLRSIYGLSNTPDISFDNMKGLGSFNTLALKTMFLSAHIKAADSEEIFGEGVQRRINFLKAALVSLDAKLKPAKNMIIKPKFTYLLPDDFAEELDNIIKAKGAGILSTESAVKANPLVNDAEAEIAAIALEKEVTPPANGGGA